MPVQNKVSEKATANKDEAGEEEFSFKGRTGKQLDKDISSKNRSGWTKVDGGLEVWRSGVLRGGAPGSGSKVLVSALTIFGNLHHA